jgi:hypothetical protein
VVPNKPVEQSQLSEPSFVSKVVMDSSYRAMMEKQAKSMVAVLKQKKKAGRALRNQSRPAKQVVEMARDMYAWRVGKSGNREQASSRVPSRGIGSGDGSKSPCFVHPMPYRSYQGFASGMHVSGNFYL